MGVPILWTDFSGCLKWNYFCFCIPTHKQMRKRTNLQIKALCWKRMSRNTHTYPSKHKHRGSVGPQLHHIPARWSSTACVPFPYRWHEYHRLSNTTNLSKAQYTYTIDVFVTCHVTVMLCYVMFWNMSPKKHKNSCVFLNVWYVWVF